MCWGVDAIANHVGTSEVLRFCCVFLCVCVCVCVCVCATARDVEEVFDVDVDEVRSHRGQLGSLLDSWFYFYRHLSPFLCLAVCWQFLLR